MSITEGVRGAKLPEGYVSKAIRLVAREEDFKTLAAMKTGERSDYVLKHAQVLARPKKKPKKRFRVYLDFSEEELNIIDQCANKANRKRAQLVKSALDFYLGLAGHDFQKALSESAVANEQA